MNYLDRVHVLNVALKAMVLSFDESFIDEAIREWDRLEVSGVSFPYWIRTYVGERWRQFALLN